MPNFRFESLLEQKAVKAILKVLLSAEGGTDFLFINKALITNLDSGKVEIC